MKNAIWNIAPSGDFVFRGMANDGLDLASPDFVPLIEAIVSKFSDQCATPKQIAEFVGSDQTNYHSSQFKKNALKVLEREGRLRVHPDDTHRRKRRFTYPDSVRFMITAGDKSA